MRSGSECSWIKTSSHARRPVAASSFHASKKASREFGAGERSRLSRSPTFRSFVINGEASLDGEAPTPSSIRPSIQKQRGTRRRDWRSIQTSAAGDGRRRGAALASIPLEISRFSKAGSRGPRSSWYVRNRTWPKTPLGGADIV